MCVTQTGFIFLSLSGSGGATWATMSEVYQQCWKEWASWCAWQDVLNNAISAPKLANFLVHLFQVGLAWNTIGIYCSGISTFLELHHFHKASNNAVILKLMHHFYLQCPPSHKHFDPWDVECLLVFCRNDLCEAKHEMQSVLTFWDVLFALKSDRPCHRWGFGSGWCFLSDLWVMLTFGQCTPQ